LTELTVDLQDKLKLNNMKAYKTIISAVTGVFFHGLLIAQSGLPRTTQVFQDIKANAAVYDNLKTRYKIENPKACKFEMKMTIGGGDVIVSDWSTYKSQEGERLNYYWPDDRAYTVFTVTTPASSEGVTYSLPLVVEYSRIKNSVLQNNWSFYWWYFDTPYSSTGGKEDPLFYDLLIAKLSEIEGDLVPYKRNEIPTAILNFTSIQKIEKSDVADLRQNYSNSDNVTRTYAVYGEASQFSDSDDSEIELNLKDCMSYLEVSFTRPKENGKDGEWELYSFNGGWGVGIKKSTPTDDKTLYKTVGSHGFKTVFQKEKQPKATPYFSERYQKQYAAEVTPILLDFYNKKEGAAEKLKSYIIPGGDEIFQSFQDFFQELETKLVKVVPNTLNSPNHDGMLARLHVNANEVDNGYFMIYTKVERKAHTAEKGLAKQYKDAGMSKDVMNRFGGEYKKSDNLEFKIILIDDQIKIASKLEWSETIPF